MTFPANSIHPSAVIGPEVTLGEGNTVGPHAVLLGPLVLGDNNWIGAHAVIGAPAEIYGIDHGAAWSGALVGTGVQIGSSNVFREYVTVHQGHYDVTTVGDGCYIMNKVYLAHDVRIDDRVTMASSVTLGGHVHVGTGANLGMNCTVHQRRIIGPGTMVGMSAVVSRDIPPFAKAFGSPCRIRGVNAIGMQRSGHPQESVDFLAALYAAGAPVPSADEAPDSLAEALRWWADQVAQ